MNSLTWGDVHLDGPEPWIFLSARITKNRKQAKVVLLPPLVEVLLRNRPEAAMPYEWVFRGKVPSVAKLKSDLAAARISFTDEQGRRIDLHAMRKTFGTRLFAAGVPPGMAQQLMRVSDYRLLADIYTDVSQLPLSAELQRLPTLSMPGAETSTASS
jgi:integrase